MMSLGFVSRLTRLFRSNWLKQSKPGQIFRSMTQICEIRGDENHNLTLPQLACYWIYGTIPLRSVCSNLHSDIAFSWKFVLFSIHITLLGQDIYIHHVGYVCSSNISIVLWGDITSLLALKLHVFHGESILRPFALQPKALPLHQATR